MSTDCLRCVHFKQTGNQEFSSPGYCNWMPSGEVASWLTRWIDDDDPYYGPKKQAHKAWDESGRVFIVNSDHDCKTFKEASKKTIKKRMSDEWYAK